MRYVDEVVELETPSSGAIAAWFEDFRQVTDDPVQQLVDEARRSLA